MLHARSASFRAGPLPDKRGFAKAARGFAKRTWGGGRPPGFPMLWIASAAAAVLMTVTGGFGTGTMPLHSRAAFWLVLMGWSALKWQAWFIATVRSQQDWPRAAAIGALLLSLPIPLEITLSARAVGIAVATPDPWRAWGNALAIGAVILVTGMLIVRASGYRPRWRTPAPGASTLLARARIAPEALLAIEAEDHYCRVHRRGAPSALLHYRFGDALGEVAALDGAQVHRGAWVAAGAIERAERDGRRWRLVLADGTRLPVSASYAAEARRRGWLRRA